MADYGVTKEGFRVKPFVTILEEKAARAREMFGGDVDLRSTSALRKLLDLASFEDHELWKRMEVLYYSNFSSTASGDALDLLGEDLGVERRFLRAEGTAALALSGAAPGRLYHLPVGTLLVTAAPERHFRTLGLVTLSADKPEAEVAIEALERGPQGNVPASAVNAVDPLYAERFLRLGEATIGVENPEPTAGGERLEDDTAYRDALIGHPRTLWTLAAVKRAVQRIDGVRDTRLVDPAGGVDVSLSRFNLFGFSQRRFGTHRHLGSPYRFEVLVATHPGFLWESVGAARGVAERVEEALAEVRPVSIFPVLRRANHVRVGIRARVLTLPGHDREAVAAAIRERLERRINALGLGRAVLYSEVVTDVMGVPGVVDVTGLRLRRCPPQIHRVGFSRHLRFQAREVELPVGENLRLEPDEIAEFKVDSELLEVEVKDR